MKTKKLNNRLQVYELKFKVQNKKRIEVAYKLVDIVLEYIYSHIGSKSPRLVTKL